MINRAWFASNSYECCSIIILKNNVTLGPKYDQAIIETALHSRFARRRSSSNVKSITRLSLSYTGKVRYTLKTPYRDGTTQVAFDGAAIRPVDFIASLMKVRFQEEGRIS